MPDATRVADERHADPDRDAEVERHPDHLVLPVRPAVGDHPARGDVQHALSQAEVAASGGLIGQPSGPIHGHIDAEHEGHVGDARRATAQEHGPPPRQAAGIVRRHAHDQKSRAQTPDRLFGDVSQVRGGQHGIPGTGLGDHDKGNQDERGDPARHAAGQARNLVEQERPLRYEAKLGRRRDRAADHDARKPVVEQADARNVEHRHHGAEGAPEDVHRRKNELQAAHPVEFSRHGRLSPAQGRRGAKPGDDVEYGHAAQQIPPGHHIECHHGVIMPG